MNSEVYVISEDGYVPRFDSYSQIIGVYSSMKLAEDAFSKYIDTVLKDANSGYYGELNLKESSPFHGEVYSEAFFEDGDYYILIKIEEFKLNAEI